MVFSQLPFYVEEAYKLKISTNPRLRHLQSGHRENVYAPMTLGRRNGCMFLGLLRRFQNGRGILLQDTM